MVLVIKLFEPKPASLADLRFLGLNLFAGLFSGCYGFPRAAMYFRLLLECTFRYDSLESLCNRLFLSPDRFQFYFKTVTVEEVVDFSGIVFKECLVLLKRHRYLRRGVYVAIDFTDRDYEGHVDRYVFNTVKRKGNRHHQVTVHRYATLAIVAKGFKYTLAVLPVKRTDKQAIIVDQLLNMVKGMVKIRAVVMDRGFYDVDVLSVVEKHKTRFIIPVKRNPGVSLLYWVSTLTSKWNWVYVMHPKRKTPKPVSLHLQEVQVADYIGVITNVDMKKERMNTLLKIYAYRWNIENSYKECRNYQVKTSSRNHAYRLLIMVISHLMMNLQELARQATGLGIRMSEMLEVFKLLLEAIGKTRKTPRKVWITKKLTVKIA